MTRVEADTGTEAELRARIAKLERINAALMTHVERVTDQHEGAYALFQTAIMLDGRVRRRTEELTGLMHRLERSNQALEAAKNEAEQANRSKTRFLAAASHDLLQPLNAARLSASALGDMPLETEVAEIVRRVERGLDTIEDVIKTLLDISKLDAGIVLPHRSTVRLADLLSEIDNDFRLLAEAKGLRFHLRCAGDLVVDTDVKLLKRIVGNLVSNAVRYTERGGVLVSARKRQSRCRLDVVDTGCGIPAAEHELVFEEFFRGRSSSTGTETGLGLGLSIVRRMASTLGLKLDFRSRVDHGSWFWLDLPLGNGTPLNSTNDLPPSASFAGIRALIVENDGPTLEAITRLALSWGVEVLAVQDPRPIMIGQEEIASVDVILTDYHLGHGVSGLDVIAALRPMMNKAVPAVVMTADLTEAVQQLVDAAGCDLVHKPIKPAALRSLLSYKLGPTRSP